MKSFEYLNNQINKVSKKCELSDQEDFFSDDWFNSLTSKDLPKILSPSILHTLQTNSNTKNIKNSSVKNGWIDNKIQERESAEVPEFEINKSSAKESDSDELLLNIHFSKDNSKNTKSNELENKRKDIGYNIKPVKIKSRNNQELFNNWKSESINPSIIKIKNKDKNAVIHFNGKHNFSQLKIKDINTLNTQRSNMVDGLNKETRRKLNAQSKYSHPFSEFIKNSEKVKHNEEMFKKIFKKNLKRKTSFKFLGLGNWAQNTKESKYTNGGDKREKNNVLQDPTTIHISKNDLVENEVSINFCPTKINEEKLKLYRIKEYRSKSHDPTSNRYFRGSIQLNEIEKISECHNRRINSVRKERKQPNVTMVHNNLSSKLAFSKFINSPSRKLDKEYRDIPIPSNELLQPKFDIFHHLNKFKIEQSREFGITARFGQANQPKCADYKNPILTPKDSKLSSPARMSFFSDECHDNFRYTFFPNNESEQKMSLNTKSKNNHRCCSISIAPPPLSGDILFDFF